jgi:putative RecB family exonuclease
MPPKLTVGLCRHRMLGVALEPAHVAGRLEASWSGMVTDEGIAFESPEEEQDAKRQTGDLVGAYLAYIPRDEPRPLAVEAALESPLVDPTSGEDLGIPLVGIVDLILDAPTGPLIADFKTAARSSPPLEITHEIQLTAYAWLFRQAAGRDESGLEIRSLVKTKAPKVEFHGYPARTEAHLRRLFAVVHEYLDALDRARFNFRPGWGCSTCDFREVHCRRWSG